MSNNMIDTVRSIEQALIHHDEYKIHYDMIMNLPIVVALNQQIQELREALKHANEAVVKVEVNKVKVENKKKENNSGRDYRSYKR